MDYTYISSLEKQIAVSFAACYYVCVCVFHHFFMWFPIVLFALTSKKYAVFPNHEDNLDWRVFSPHLPTFPCHLYYFKQSMWPYLFICLSQKQSQ